MNDTPIAANPVLDRAGSLEVRLATKPEEIEAAQRLRYEVFYREMSALPSDEMKRQQRDFDDYDPLCQHIIVVDHNAGLKQIGTYRMMRENAAARSPKGFYTGGEFDITEMLARRAGQRLLELGRSCVLKEYRTGPTMQLLWRGIFAYLIRHEIDLMFGCGSLPGTDPSQLKLPLSYLYHFHLTPEADRVRALPSRYSEMNLMPKEAIDEGEALRALPPLIKGYVRAGAKIGDGAVIDHQFGTTDVLIYLPFTGIAPRTLAYLKKKISPDAQAP